MTLTENQKTQVIDELSQAMPDTQTGWGDVRDVIVWALEAYLPTFEDDELMEMAKEHDIEIEEDEDEDDKEGE